MFKLNNQKLKKNLFEKIQNHIPLTIEEKKKIEKIIEENIKKYNCIDVWKNSFLNDYSKIIKDNSFKILNNTIQEWSGFDKSNIYHVIKIKETVFDKINLYDINIKDNILNLLYDVIGENVLNGKINSLDYINFISTSIYDLKIISYKEYDEIIKKHIANLKLIINRELDAKEFSYELLTNGEKDICYGFDVIDSLNIPLVEKNDIIIDINTNYSCCKFEFLIIKSNKIIYICYDCVYD